MAIPETDIVVYEREDSPGGTAQTDTVGGYTIDRGPNGFLTNVPDSVDLVQALGLEAELRSATEAVKHRFLFVREALQSLPTSPAEFITTPLLGLGAKARVALEPFAHRRDPNIDETVYAFAQRRLGTAFADAFITPMVLGITSGDAKSTSLESLFPRMRALEDRHGSLLKGMIYQQRQARKAAEEGRVRGGPTGPGGRLTSFRSGGVATLTKALGKALGPDLKLSIGVSGLRYEKGAFSLKLDDGSAAKADAVVLATPAFVTARLVRDLAPEAVEDLLDIPYTGVRVLGLGYARADVPHPLDGFGFLVPPGQGVGFLGCLWTSTLFPDQAPEGKVLLRVIAGGVRDPNFVDLSDDEALESVRQDLYRSMGIAAEPEMVHHVRWPRAIPQYTVGHAERVKRIENALSKVPGLLTTGNAYHGIGLNDCVRDAERIVATLAQAFGIE
jgi:oxygen-dependent protoporphyrinogen oxidase